MGLTHTVSGNIASFRTPSKVPIESLKFHFLPKQASGTPTPANPIPIEGWAGLNGRRAGKNLFNYDINNFELLEFNNGSGTMIQRQVYHTGLSNGVFTSSAVLKTGSRPSYNLFNIGRISNGAVIVDNTFIGTSETVRTKTIGANEELVIISTTDSLSNANYNALRYDIQIEVGLNASDYESYAEEQIPITFPANSKNLYDVETYPLKQGYILWSTDGTAESGYTQFATVLSFVPCENIAGKTVTLNKRSGGIWPGFSFYSSDNVGSCIGGLKNNGGEAGTPWTITIPENAKYMRFTVPSDTYDIQIELGDTATSYEPYSSDNTFYGGYVDPVAGEIVAEYKKHIYDGTTLTIGMNYKVSGKFYGKKAASDCQYGSNGYVISNMLKSQINHGNNVCSPRPSDPGYLFDFDLATFCELTTEQYDALTIQEQTDLVNDYLADLYENGTPLIIIYKLITPIHIPISPQEIKSYLDYNNFWSDANDITEVTYDVTESKDMLAARHKIIVNSPHIANIEDSIAHFTSDISAPLTKLKISFTPQKEGSAQSTPSNIRPFVGPTEVKLDISGKNMLNCYGYAGNGTAAGITYTAHKNENNVIDYITVDGTTTSTNAFRNLTYTKPVVPTSNRLPRGRLSFNSYGTNTNVLPLRPDRTPGAYNMNPYDGGGIYIDSGAGWYDYNTNVNDPYTSWARIQIYPAEIGEEINDTVYPMMCHYLDRGCDFEPYHGKTIYITFPQSGKNYYNATAFTKTQSGVTWTANNDNYTITVSGIPTDYSMITTNTSMIPSSGKICLSANFNELTNVAWDNYYIYNSNMELLGSAGGGGNGYKVVDLDSYTDPKYIKLSFKRSSNDVEMTGTIKPMIEVGIVPSTYEPYTNMIYGGYIDLLNGILAETWRKFKVSDYTWTYKEGNHRFQMQLAANECSTSAAAGWTRFAQCDRYKQTDSTSGYGNLEIATYGNNYIYIRDDSYTNVEDFMNNVGDAEIVYELANPIIHLIDPIELKTFIGTNNIWSSLNGNVEIEYWTH